jgi:HEPN domain-containing protein
MILHPEEFLDPRKINQHLLDALLTEFINKYPRIQEVEELLSEAVELLDDVEEYGKAATGLIQSLMTVYSVSSKPIGMALA